MITSETISIPVVADTSAAEKSLDGLKTKIRPLATSLTQAFQGALTGGKALSDVLRNLARQLGDIAFKAALNPLQNLLTGQLANTFGGQLGSLLGFAKGGVLNSGTVQPFAKGGVVAAPSYFPMSGAGRLGLTGEAGPEAILPLARGPDGRLGVRNEGGAAPVNVSVTIQTRDAESFRRSEGQVSAMLARAVSRGHRNL